MTYLLIWWENVLAIRVRTVKWQLTQIQLSVTAFQKLCELAPKKLNKDKQKPIGDSPIFDT